MTKKDRAWIPTKEENARLKKGKSCYWWPPSLVKQERENGFKKADAHDKRMKEWLKSERAKVGRS